MIFGIIGDLAKVMTFRSLYRLANRLGYVQGGDRTGEGTSVRMQP